MNNRDLKTFEVSSRNFAGACRSHSGERGPRDRKRHLDARGHCAPAQGRLRRVSYRRKPDAPARSRRGAGCCKLLQAMSLWIKICANTSLADAQLAAEAGADAVGFVFAPSPREVTAEQVEPRLCRICRRRSRRSASLSTHLSTTSRRQSKRGPHRRPASLGCAA